MVQLQKVLVRQVRGQVSIISWSDHSLLPALALGQCSWPQFLHMSERKSVRIPSK